MSNSFSISIPSVVMLCFAQGESRLTRFETTAPGRSAIGIRNDGKLLAVAGWDGE